MTDLRFITDEQLRNMIERDKKELDNCLKHQMCKSALLLAGSIIEAILVDFFLAFPRTNSAPEQILNTNLATLIDWAEQDGLITSRTKELSTVIRNYRNLIHPGREYRLSEKVDIHTATVATSLVEIIVQEVADNYAKRLGYTAEQVINKVKLDPSCSAIFQHMVEKMVPVERVKLFKSIPKVCQLGDDANTVAESFVQLHNLLKGRIPLEVVRGEATKVYEYIRQTSKREALFYLRFFVGNLDLLESDQTEAIIAYLFNILDKDSEEELELCNNWKVFRIGKQLNNVKGVEQVRRLIWEQLWEQDSTRDDSILCALGDILSDMDYEEVKHIPEWLRGELQKGFWSETDRVTNWADYIENISIPF